MTISPAVVVNIMLPVVMLLIVMLVVSVLVGVVSFKISGALNHFKFGAYTIFNLT